MKKSNLVKLTTASLIALTGITISDHMDQTTNNNGTQNVEAATTPSIVKVNTGAGTSIGLRTAPSDTASFTSQTVENGSAWRVAGIAKDAQGNTWYNLAVNSWIKASAVVDASAPVSQAPTNNTSSVDKVIATAKAQIGKPYVWGGKGPNGFDCSGLMQYSFKQATGKDIGGWTVAQESAGQTVSLSQLKPGDLVFWGSRGNTYHVALYIGNNQYVAAPQPGQTVKVQTISSYFMPSFGVRVL